MADGLPAEADEPYGVTPGEFTAARNALAKRLRAEGRKQEAALVAALRKPPVTAWALNQLARRQAGLVERVIEAGRLLREATEQAMTGDRSRFRGAQALERDAIQQAVEAASDLAEAAGIGLPQGGSERMAETLRAAMVNPAIAHQLRGGVLEKDASAPGLGLEGMTASIPTKKAHSEADEARTDRGEREGLRAQVEQELRDAQARHAEARAKADEAEREAEGLRRVADAVKDEVDNLSRRLADLGN